MSAHIKYVGPFEAVDVDGVGTVKKDESVEVDSDLAKSLLEQDTNWAIGKKPVATESKGA